MKIRSWAILLLTIALASCEKSTPWHYQGYIEGELIFLASPNSGLLEDMLVTRGQQVKKGNLLFKLDQNPELFLLQQNEAELVQAKKIYKDLQNPRRNAEIEAINAQIEQVNAQLELAELRVQRYRKLSDKQLAAKDTLDEAVARYNELAKLKAQYQSNLDLAKQGSREQQIQAQQASIVALSAKVNLAKWQLAQKTFYAPADGLIFDTYYRKGEFVNNRQPVASLLTPDNTRIEFFVPARELGKIRVGQTISFSCDGCPENNQATVSYISARVEFVPPLVYSRDNIDKLVFRVQASIAKPSEFKPGQPVVISGNAHD